MLRHFYTVVDVLESILHMTLDVARIGMFLAFGYLACQLALTL